MRGAAAMVEWGRRLEGMGNLPYVTGCHDVTDNIRNLSTFGSVA
jgi:hypothetical protein